ncbi:MAG: hypothetical protein K8S23_05950 [Candidatus Cloacimonetes bacterium]|nr:hypothetical protein [Candidatus Cloacimonadota bacterium]
MKNILLTLFVMIVLSCSIPSDLGIPTWNTKYNLKIINDSWDIVQLAEEDTTIIVIEEDLFFHEFFNDRSIVDEIDIDDPAEKEAIITLGEMNSDLEAVNDSTIIVSPFDIEPIEKELDPFEEFIEITFSSGLLRFVIHNETSIVLGDSPENPLVAQIINYDTGELLFEESYPEDIMPNSFSSLLVNLSDITIPNTIKVVIMGGSKGSNGETIIIDTSEEMHISVQFEDIKASHAIARIPEQEIDISSGYKDVSTPYPAIFGTLELAGNSRMVISYSTPIPASAEIILLASNDEEEMYFVLNNGEYPVLEMLGNSAPPDSMIIEFQANESNLNEFLSILPTKIEYSLYPIIGDDSDEYYEISSTDSVFIQVDFFAELNINADCWIIPISDNVPKTTSENTIDFNDDLYNAFVSGGFHLDYSNTTGLRVGFDILLSETDFTTFEEILYPDTTNVKILHIPLLETTIDTTDFKSVDIILEHLDLQPMLADSIFIATKLQLKSEADEPLSGIVKVLGEMNLELTISSDLIEQ